jgi:hypothetical protein
MPDNEDYTMLTLLVRKEANFTLPAPAAGKYIEFAIQNWDNYLRLSWYYYPNGLDKPKEYWNYLLYNSSTQSVFGRMPETISPAYYVSTTDIMEQMYAPNVNTTYNMTIRFIHPCDNGDCGNQGTCNRLSGGYPIYNCTCNNGWTGMDMTSRA